MGKCLRSVSFFLFAASLVAQAAPKAGDGGPLAINGSFEGGYGYTWASGVKDSQFLLDNFNVKVTLTPSDKLKLVLDNALHVSNNYQVIGATPFASFTPLAAAGANFNSPTYWSNARFRVGNLTYATLGAYMEYKWSNSMTSTVGYFRTPFGMESLWNRFDMGTYYYSQAFGAASVRGWTYDVGIKKSWNAGPGGVEVALTDGRSVTTTQDPSNTPALSARAWWEIKGGNWSLTPVATTYLGRWRGGPEDLGLTGGLMFKSGGMWWANGEFLYTSAAPTPGATKQKLISGYIEPGFDFGIVALALKGEYVSVDPGTGSTSDFNIGASLSHEYDSRYRVKLSYQHVGIGGKVGMLGGATSHINDVRLLIGTKW